MAQLISQVFDYCSNLTLTSLLTSIIIAITAFVTLRQWAYGRKMPPGPWSLPWLGHIGIFKQMPHSFYKGLSNIYGPIFGVRVGCRYTVVVSDYDMINEMCALDAFTVRPRGVFQLSKDIDNFGDMSGPIWKDHRRLVLKSLRSMGMGTTKGEIAVQNQINTFVEKLKEQIKSEPKVLVRPYIAIAVRNIIFTMICGETFENDPDAIRIIQEITEGFMKFMMNKVMSYYFPLLKVINVFNPQIRKMHRIQNEFNEVLNKQISKHKKNTSEEPSDYMDFYIQEMTEKPSPNFSESTLIGNSLIILLAGSDSIRIAMEWFLMTLAENQQIQDKMHKEIIAALGKEKRPDWNDRNQLPYTQAFILEVFRWKELVPINDPRGTDQDVMFRDYLIPKDSLVIFSFQAIHQDKAFWGDPEQFRPDRFLTPDGKSIDNKMSERIFVFSLGKRSCPGERLAVVQMFLYVSAIVQQFKLKVTEAKKKEIMNIAPELEDPEILFELRD